MKELFESDFPLSQLTSIGLGGEAKYFYRVFNVEELVEATKYAHSEKMKFFILGGGSNIIFSDMGYDEDCNAIRAAWKSGGSQAGYASVSDRLLERAHLVAEILHFARGRLTRCVAGQAPLPCLQELLRPAVVETFGNPLPPA